MGIINPIKEGEKFGRLTALGESELRPIGKCLQWYEKMECDCGNTTWIRRCNLRSGKTKSCGCITKTKDGESSTRFYNIYRCIIKRCTNPSDTYFSIYGGKGIKCEWESYEDFKRDMYDSYIEHCKEYGEKQTSIDRIDNDKNYSKDNCRWATWKEQNNNQSRSVKYDWHGQKLGLSQIYDLANPIVSRTVYYTRVRQDGWDIDRALNIPNKWR